MAGNIVFKRGAYEILKGGLATPDIRCAWLITGNSAEADNTSNAVDPTTGTVASIVTLNEFDNTTDTGYVNGGGFALASETFTGSASINGAFLDATDIAAGSVTAGNGAVVGLLMYQFLTSFTASIPIAYIDTGTNLPFTPNGGTIDIAWSSTGFLHAIGAA